MGRMNWMAGAGALLIGLSAGAQSAEKGPQLLQKNELKGAVEVRLTSRGQKAFGSALGQILGNIGYQVNEGYFPEFNYEAEKPVNLDELEQTMPDQIKIFKNVRNLLTQWLVGFTLADHKPAVKIADSQYHATFSRFALVTDENLMKSLGKTDGAVFAVELEVSKFDAQTAAIRAWDMNNEHLGKIGLNDVAIKAGSKEMPVKMRIPVYVYLNENGKIQFEPLEITENFDQIPIEIKYQKVIVPTVVIQVDGKSYQMNNDQLQKYLNDQMPEILKVVRANMSKFAREIIPDFFNHKAKPGEAAAPTKAEELQNALEEVQTLEAPGAEPTDKRPDFKWGLILKKMNLKDSVLTLGMSAFVSDPLGGSTMAPYLPKDSARGNPNFNLDQATYDLGLSVDRGLVNRILKLAYERKNFEKIALKDGTVLSLRAAPTIDALKPEKKIVPKNAKETFVRATVSIEYQPERNWLSAEYWALAEKIIITVDVVAKLRQAADKSGMQVILQEIDADSVFMDPKYLSNIGAAVKNTVYKKLHDKLVSISAALTKEETSIPGTLAFPPKILGLTLDVVKVDMSPSGHLFMYTNFVTGTGGTK